MSAKRQLPKCQWCEKEMIGIYLSRMKFCSPTCRVYASREKVGRVVKGIRLPAHTTISPGSGQPIVNAGHFSR